MEKLERQQQLVTVFFFLVNMVATTKNGKSRKNDKNGKDGKNKCSVSELSFYLMNLFKSETTISHCLRNTCTFLVFFSKSFAHRQ